MYTYHPQLPVRESLASAQSIAGVEILYEGVRKVTNRVVVFCLAILLGLPLVYIASITIYILRRKIRGKMRKARLDFDNCIHYSNNRAFIEDLRKLQPQLLKMRNYKITRTPFILRPMVHQCQQMSSTLITLLEWMESRAESLNYNGQMGEVKHFTFLDVEDQWKKRNKSYTFWV